ncbi:MAG: hypothetical protein ABJA93_01585 [Sporichthyaceae bacterium]
MMQEILRGAAAGAAGTTALNAVTYADMTWRARPASQTPEQTVEKLAEAADVSVPGEDEARANRLSALGALSGIVTGVGVGALYVSDIVPHLAYGVVTAATYAASRAAGAAESWDRVVPLAARTGIAITAPRFPTA